MFGSAISGVSQLWCTCRHALTELWRKADERFFWDPECLQAFKRKSNAYPRVTCRAHGVKGLGHDSACPTHQLAPWGGIVYAQQYVRRRVWGRPRPQYSALYVSQLEPDGFFFR